MSTSQYRNFLKPSSIWNLIASKLNSLLSEYFGRIGAKGIVAFNLVSRKQIYLMNLRCRGEAKSTDILAFPTSCSHHEHQIALKEQFLNAKIRGKSGPIQFGHLIICPAVLERKLANVRSKRLMELKVTRLLVHGFVHLANLDHHTGKEFRVMQALEFELLKAIETNRN